MRTFLTEFRAVSVLTGEIQTFNGPEVLGITAGDAQNNLYNMGMPYCKVIIEKIDVVDMSPLGTGVKQKPKYN